VAFYAGTITFFHSETFFRPRLQPLIIDSKISPVAVIRIENKDKDGQLPKSQLSKTVDLITEVCS